MTLQKKKKVTLDTKIWTIHLSFTAQVLTLQWKSDTADTIQRVTVSSEEQVFMSVVHVDHGEELLEGI